MSSPGPVAVCWGRRGTSCTVLRGRLGSESPYEAEKPLFSVFVLEKKGPDFRRLQFILFHKELNKRLPVSMHM